MPESTEDPNEWGNDTIITHVEWALTQFYLKDTDLIAKDASEWTMAYRIAMYLRERLKAYEDNGWRIDGEYNRMGEIDDKRRDDGTEYRPDVIFHKRARGNPDKDKNNILHCEIKKRVNIDDDVEKILEVINDTDKKYKYGLMIYNIERESIKLKWFPRKRTEKMIVDKENCIDIMYRFENSVLTKQT